MAEEIGKNLFDDLKTMKNNLILDLDYSNFEKTCYLANDLLMKNDYFLRIYERKEKFRQINHKTSKNKSITREVSSCVKQKFNGFNVLSIEYDKKIRKKFVSIDIIYKPVKKVDDVIECFFSTDFHLANKAAFNKGVKISHSNAHQCYFCGNYYVKKTRYERHMSNCAGQPGIAYDFNIQNLVTFKDTLKYKGEIPLTAYADFETVAPSDDYQDPENRNMYAVSYAIIFAFHPDLNFERVITERSFGYSTEELLSLNYLTSEQQHLVERKTLLQLRDAAIDVSKTENKNAISIMFNVEVKFVSDVLSRWFNAKIKSKHIELDPFVKMAYSRENPIDWTKDKCVICNFPMNVQPKRLSFSGPDMSYIDFMIRKEHAFLRNIYSSDEIMESKNIATIENYQKAFEKYLKIIKNMEEEIRSVETYELVYSDELREFLEEHCPAYSHCVKELAEEIKQFEIKNNKAKIPKFTMQIYAFVYDCPSNKFDFQTVTTTNLFEKLYRVFNFKVHCHHSHITSKILGYVHDFCNWKIRENKTELSLIGHNFLGFDIFCMLKGFRSSCWGTKELNMGGLNLTTVNFANIGSQVKIIDTLKYYQTSLASIGSTATEAEKNMIRKLTAQFISRHTYFGKIWRAKHSP